MGLADKGKKVEKLVDKEYFLVQREFRDDVLFERKLNGSNVERSQLLVDFNKYLVADETAVIEIHEGVVSKISDWKGDVDEELKQYPDSEFKHHLQDLFNRLLDKEKKVSEVMSRLNKAFDDLKTILNQNELNKNGLIEGNKGLKRHLDEFLSLDKEVKSIVVDLEKAVKELEVKSHKLKNYKELLGAPQEKLHDLLIGRNYYARYTVDERRGLWNRWVESTTQRVLVNFQAPSGLVLTKFVFNNFVFKNCVLEKVNLQEANLAGANLWGADLMVANLREANLQGADLMVANLREANLRGAHLRGAHLQGANLQEADLQDVNGLTKEMLKKVLNVDKALNVPKNLK